LNKLLLLEAQVEPRRRATWKGKLRLGHSLCFTSFGPISSLPDRYINMIQHSTVQVVNVVGYPVDPSINEHSATRANESYSSICSLTGSPSLNTIINYRPLNNAIERRLYATPHFKINHTCNSVLYIYISTRAEMIPKTRSLRQASAMQMHIYNPPRSGPSKSPLIPSPLLMQKANNSSNQYSYMFFHANSSMHFRQASLNHPSSISGSRQTISATSGT
jgi:hypothetical protein